MKNPNEELLQQFKKISKQVEALGVQKKYALYIERDLRPNPFDKSLYMPPFQNTLRLQGLKNTEEKETLLITSENFVLHVPNLVMSPLTL